MSPKGLFLIVPGGFPFNGLILKTAMPASEILFFLVGEPVVLAAVAPTSA